MRREWPAIISLLQSFNQLSTQSTERPICQVIYNHDNKN